MYEPVSYEDCTERTLVSIQESELEAYEELRRLVWDEDDMDGALCHIRRMRELGYPGWGE